MCETLHRRDRINPMYLTNAHRAYVTNDGGCAEGDSSSCACPSNEGSSPLGPVHS